MKVFRNAHPQFAERSIPGAGSQRVAAIPALVERGRQTLGRFFDWLESRLERSPFLVGDVYTMADVTALCAVDFVAWVDIKIPAGNSHSQRWHAEVSARPSAKA